MLVFIGWCKSRILWTPDHINVVKPPKKVVGKSFTNTVYSRKGKVRHKHLDKFNIIYGKQFEYPSRPITTIPTINIYTYLTLFLTFLYNILNKGNKTYH